MLWYALYRTTFFSGYFNLFNFTFSRLPGSVFLPSLFLHLRILPAHPVFHYPAGIKNDSTLNNPARDVVRIYLPVVMKSFIQADVRQTEHLHTY